MESSLVKRGLGFRDLLGENSDPAVLNQDARRKTIYDAL